MKLLKYFLIFFFLTTFLFEFTSCNIFKHTEKSSLKISKKLKENLIDFDNLSAKALISYRDKNNSYSLVSDVIIYKDSLIYINAKLPFGISIAKILFRTDSIFYQQAGGINYKSSVSLFFKSYNLAFDYNSVQAIFTADIFPYPDTVSLSSYTSKVDSIEHFTHKVKQSKYPYFTQFYHNFDIKNNLIKNFKIIDYSYYTMLYANYQDYYEFNSKYFPKNISLQVITTDTVFINIKFKNVKINTNPNFKF